MHLEELLGKELCAQVTEALKGKGADGGDAALMLAGEGVPKGEHDALAAKLEAAERQAREAQAALAQTRAELKAQAASYEQQLAGKDLDFALRAAIQDAHDPALVAGLLDKGKLKLGEDGQVTGLEDQLKGLRESKPFLFAPKAPPVTFSGTKPAEAGEPTDAALSQIERFMGL